MKFINYLESIAGISVYPMAALLLLFTFFIGASLWAFKADKKLMDHISRIPLDNDETNPL
ncbi:CcoQ/FixQ family Cbb3-type cytochrome c oxidase assembly chaperone [Chitinophaga sp. 22321]|uniref:CcoQ/FixQ family Cbb3-type cytochrome c oxidase assembly chaperone n=1 Tax=Chitinophaga hostae TaxID=2831022 RepID=A0ABS5ISK1_9BACT|nr:CcoQ/FixQ family Cbb3-type cytochrome c oxidase assembly chaperone [Chitinophaga hostae]MBS0025929.1 CcoQ/FixQ family Cbb3-type cytochrome c oxidase assembly chaperone [Chitinophaga hostae]